MNLMGMSFQEFIWRDNPTSLTVTDARALKETLLPYAGSRTENLGRQKRKVTGEGYFTGEDCWEQWLSLQKVYHRGGAGSLRLPGQEPFWAVMESLKLVGVAGENLIKYSFSFLETQAGEDYTGKGIHHAAAGETLWDYAWRYGKTMKEMTAANPDIRDIGALQEGEEVRVP